MISLSRCKTAKMVFLVWLLCLTKSSEEKEPLMRYIDQTLKLTELTTTEKLKVNFKKMKDQQKDKQKVNKVTDPSNTYNGIKAVDMTVECSSEKEHERCVISIKKKRVWILVKPCRVEKEKTTTLDFFKIQEALKKMEKSKRPVKTAMLWPEIFECEKDECGFIATMERLHRKFPKSQSIDDQWVKEKLVALIMYIPDNDGQFLSDYMSDKKVCENKMKKETVDKFVKDNLPQKMLQLLKVLEEKELTFEFLPSKIFVETDDNGIHARILPFSKDARILTDVKDNEDKSKHIIDEIKPKKNNKVVSSLRNLINGTYEKAVYSWYYPRWVFGYSQEKKDLKEVITMIMKTKRNDTDWKKFEDSFLKEEPLGGAWKFGMAVRARIKNFDHIQSAEQQFEEDLKKARKKNQKKDY
jgi:hypothetical protein